MTEKSMKTDWSIEKIRSLSDDQLGNLQNNALERAAHDVVARCTEVAAERLQARRKAGKNNNNSRAGTKSTVFLIAESAVVNLEAKILALPAVQDVPNALARLALQASPHKTLRELWRQFIICGFSSQENSEEDSPLGRFLAADGPLLDLAQVRAKSCEPEWVKSEVGKHLPRQLRNKVALVVGAYPSFIEEGLPDDFLVDLCKTNGKLKVFCDLARGDSLDRDLALSKEFSRRIDHSPFPYIGNKQIRNILVNSGLAHNVVPLDSRWQKFFGEILHTNKATFSSTIRYLAIEDLLRLALIRIQKKRGDIVNLSVLDAIVFAEMSKKGVGPNGWLGSTIA